MRGLVFALALAACSDPAVKARWEVQMQGRPSALLSIWGTSESDIWAVGADQTVLHYDGETWAERDTGGAGDLWWVFGFASGAVFMGGAGGTILRHRDGAFERMTTPGVGTVFGIWGTSETDLWAVGGASGGSDGAFAWRLSGDAWIEAPGFPAELAATDVMWKVYGRNADDVWLVGSFGKTVHWDGATFTQENTGFGESLFTVHANSERFVSVGGYGSGIILENEGSGWHAVTPPASPAINGVCLTPNGGYAAGGDAMIYERRDGAWQAVETGLEVYESLHAIWIDPKGGVWAVGGKVASYPLVDGVLIHGAPGEVE